MHSFRKSLAAPAVFLVASMLLVSLVAASNPAAQGQTKSPVEGVWRVAEVVVPDGGAGEKGTTITSPQPGLVIFTRGHYSQVVVREREPRAAVAPAKDPQKLTDAEKLARYEQWRPFTANAGTYEVKEATLLIRPMVAKNVDVMTREKPLEWTFKMEGTNTLWLIPPADRAATDGRIKLTRLE